MENKYQDFFIGKPEYALDISRLQIREIIYVTLKQVSYVFLLYVVYFVYFIKNIEIKDN